MVVGIFQILKTAEEIKHKLKSYLHHREFDENPLSKNEIKEIIKNKKAIYDLKVDKRLKKLVMEKKLEKYPIEKLPKFLQDNLNNYKNGLIKMKKGYWISLYEKIDNNENLKKYAKLKCQ